jgi:hypothetical protein
MLAKPLFFHYWQKSAITVFNSYVLVTGAITGVFNSYVLVTGAITGVLVITVPIITGCFVEPFLLCSFLVEFPSFPNVNGRRATS